MTQARTGPAATAPPEPGLELVASVHATLAEPLEIGMTPAGRERVIAITGGTVSGPRLSGAVLAGGADWQTVLGDGTAVIDTRYTLRLDDGALVSVATRGFRAGPPDVLQALLDGDRVDPSRYYFRLTVSARTCAPAHDWLNRSVLVAAAVRGAASVDYDAYLLT